MEGVQLLRRFATGQYAAKASGCPRRTATIEPKADDEASPERGIAMPTSRPTTSKSYTERVLMHSSGVIDFPGSRASMVSIAFGAYGTAGACVVPYRGRVGMRCDVCSRAVSCCICRDFILPTHGTKNGLKK